MTEMLTAEGYEQTQVTLRGLQARLADIEKHTDLDLDHLAEACRTVRSMIRQCLREIKLYEAEHKEQLAEMLH